MKSLKTTKKIQRFDITFLKAFFIRKKDMNRYCMTSFIFTYIPVAKS